jgi:hypothetical protein
MVLYTASDFAGLKPLSQPGDEVKEYYASDGVGDLRYLCLARSGHIVGIVKFIPTRQGSHNFPPELIYNSASNRY